MPLILPRRFYSPVACIGIFLFAICLIWPVAEIGMVDDWSIARSAEVLANTGHIVYNGWEAPMLGWMLYAVVPSIKIFGFSYQLVRATSVAESVVILFLMQRIFIRCGITLRNATFGTLAIALSPVYLSTSVGFLTDIPGLLADVVCLYACCRAVQSVEDRKTILWIAFAALSNVVLGTARQIAWLGLLVTVPSALFLLRRRPKVLISGAVTWIIGVGCIAVALHWLDAQPYVLPEHLLMGRPHIAQYLAIPTVIIEVFLDLILILCFALFPWATLSSRKTLTKVILLFALIALPLLLLMRHGHLPMAPFLLYPENPPTLENAFLSFHMPLLGNSPAPLTRAIRLLMTLTVILAVSCVLYSIVDYFKIGFKLRTQELYRTQNFILALPFLVVYVIALLPRGIFLSCTVDRYLLFLLPSFVLLLLSLYQNQFRHSIPLVAWLLLIPCGLYSVATLHDAFATYRADLAAISELRAKGVPRTAIDGGFEYDHETQVLLAGYVYQSGIRLHGDKLLSVATLPNGPCLGWYMQQTPIVKPTYAIAFAKNECQTADEFAPISYRAWLPPFRRTLKVVHYATLADGSKQNAY
jgi:hypothetical protein